MHYDSRESRIAFDLKITFSTAASIFGVVEELLVMSTIVAAVAALVNDDVAVANVCVAVEAIADVDKPSEERVFTRVVVKAFSLIRARLVGGKAYDAAKSKLSTDDDVAVAEVL
uniref:Uncharacterized protein n=1 Tax=Glossina austeni TaxID=7395 RepID=A0A1A9VVJ1_GLOAU